MRPGNGSGAPGAPVLSARGITKEFPGVVANDAVDLDVRRGEVHTLLGENGAGKSTLAAVMSGLYRPDAGELLLDGRRVALQSPRDGLARGIGMVHQHFRLVEPFTVAENVALGDRGPTLRARYRRARRGASPSSANGSDCRSTHARGVGSLGRRAATGRDREDALPRRRDPAARRADRGADAAGSRRAVRHGAGDDRGRQGGRVHQSQARRSHGRVRSGHGHAQRSGHRRRAHRRHDRA